jgi:N utilization substance protein B
MSEASRNWDFSRLAYMDVVIMQIAIAEMLSFPNIPVSVTINEYVDLAKVYSTPKSGSYINGMLDAIARHLISTGKMLKTMDDSRQKREVNPSAEDVQEQQQDNAEVNATENGSRERGGKRDRDRK